MNGGEGYFAGKDEQQKTRFSTREGIYQFVPVIEYYRPNRSHYANSLPASLTAVHLSLVPSPGEHRLCMNVGKELHVYVYKGVYVYLAGTDVATPVDKKTFKITYPTCHNFNCWYASEESLPLLVGFNCGLIQIMDVIKKEIFKVFNDEKLVDRTKVTCIQWVPKSRHLFLASHASGQLYLYNEELPCGPTPPVYQSFKKGDGYAIHVCKAKSTRNPLYRWVIGREGVAINEFTFSPCYTYMAVVSQDGFLRVFHYDTMELVGCARSYFGGFLCACWSPDGKYVATGGEDDLVTIWSFHDKQIVARGQGHHSWVTVVAFDPYTSSVTGCEGDGGMGNSRLTTCYRLGSVGLDTQLCLWDITEDTLRQSIRPMKACNNNVVRTGNGNNNKSSNNAVSALANGDVKRGNRLYNSIGNSMGGKKSGNGGGISPPSSLARRLTSFGFGEKRNRTIPSRCGGKQQSNSSSSSNLNNNNNKNGEIYKGDGGSTSGGGDDSSAKIIGTTACPRFDQCPLLEPLICKKISNERLSALVFKEDCILMACYDGAILTWARPGVTAVNSAILPSSSNNSARNSTIPGATFEPM